ETAVYRIVQEALHNVVKHSGATSASVLMERAKNQLRVTVEDNGAGFEAESVGEERDGRRPLGIIGMQERASLLGGEVSIESEPGRGTTVFLRLPLASP